jgi:diacylglycerol kinase family enzyme
MYRAFQEKAVPAKFTISYAENSRSGKEITIKNGFVSLLFSKIRFWATGRLFLPDAKINDGKIHLLMIQECGFIKTLWIMLMAANGKHIDGNFVKYMAASKFHLTADTPFMIQVDGDIIQDAGEAKLFKKISIEAIKERLEIISL